jgi:hypothetical protein
MHWIVKSRIRPDTALKAPRAAVYLTEQLHLKPTIVALD